MATLLAGALALVLLTVGLVLDLADNAHARRWRRYGVALARAGAA
jgi:hypothetical protein